MPGTASVSTSRDKCCDRTRAQSADRPAHVLVNLLLPPRESAESQCISAGVACADTQQGFALKMAHNLCALSTAYAPEPLLAY